MKYESVQETAARLGVSVRAVQKWAIAGRLEGAVKVGNQWMIPAGAHRSAEPLPTRPVLPLISAAYVPGQAKEYVEGLADPIDRDLARGELLFFSGHVEEAARILEPHMSDRDAASRYSAASICVFANLSRGHVHLSRYAIQSLDGLVKEWMASPEPMLQAVAMTALLSSEVLLQGKVKAPRPIDRDLIHLPGGMRLWGCSLMATQACRAGNYERALAVADLGPALSPRLYPIPTIYCHITAAIALMALRRTDEAKARLEQAWALAEPDGLIEPFVEYYGVLHGLIEVCFKRRRPRVYERIAESADIFLRGIRSVMDASGKTDAADLLTLTEFTVAVLYGLRWSVKEIAAHLEISARTVSNYIANIYTKLGVSNRNELVSFISR